MQLLHNYNPLILLDRWLSILRYGAGVQFIAPSAGTLRSALRVLRQYGIKTYAYTFPNDSRARAFRVRSEQAQFAEYLLLSAGVGMIDRPQHPANRNVKPGPLPAAWGVPARNVGFGGAVLALFERWARH